MATSCARPTFLNPTNTMTGTEQVSAPTSIFESRLPYRSRPTLPPTRLRPSVPSPDLPSNPAQESRPGWTNRCRAKWQAGPTFGKWLRQQIARLCFSLSAARRDSAGSCSRLHQIRKEDIAHSERPTAPDCQQVTATRQKKGLQVNACGYQYETDELASPV
jgi:hypothetical protein